ncbi:MAG: branched-chain amino acid ABC transporter permease [Actinobacteria bacterium]|nr:branched-chain amino acid ABC transporter permease [Actinomycetota bacterium]
MDWGRVLENGLRSAFGPEASVFALAAVGLNLHYGYTGLLNFGQVGFMMVGAFGVAVSVITFGWNMWVGVAMGLTWSLGLALVIGLPTLRLRADYFAITTIASAEILRIFFRSSSAEDWSGGVFGISGFGRAFHDLNPIPAGRHGFGAISYPNSLLWTALVTWGLVIILTILLALLMGSPWGRVIRAVREDEDAVRSLGKNAFAYKMQALIRGGLIGGLAGIMFALGPQAAHPDSFSPEITFFAYTILILGGTATRLGPIVGSILFWFLHSSLETFLRQADDVRFLPDFLAQADRVGAVSTAMVGIGIILLLVFRPQGIFGKRREMVL